MAKKLKPPQGILGPFANNDQAPAQDDQAPAQENQPRELDKPGDMQKRAEKAARAAVMPVFVPPQDDRALGDMIAPTMDAIDKEMDSRRIIADDVRDKSHEQAIVAAKLQNEKDLKAMEIDAMLKRLRMEIDAQQGIKRFGPSKHDP